MEKSRKKGDSIQLNEKEFIDLKKRLNKFFKQDEKNSKKAPFKFEKGDSLGSFDTYKLLFKTTAPSLKEIENMVNQAKNHTYSISKGSTEIEKKLAAIEIDPNAKLSAKDIEMMTAGTSIMFPKLNLDKVDVVTESSGGGIITIKHIIIENKNWVNDAEEKGEHLVYYPRYHYKTMVQFDGSPYSYVGYGNDFLFTNKLEAVKSSGIRGERESITSSDVVIVDIPKPFQVGGDLIYSMCGERHILPEEEAITTGGGVFNSLSLEELSFDDIFDSWNKLEVTGDGGGINYWSFYGKNSDYADITKYDKAFLADYNTASFGSFRFDKKTGKTSDRFNDIIEVVKDKQSLAIMFPNVVTIGITKDDSKQGILVGGELRLPTEIEDIRGDNSVFPSRKNGYKRDKKVQKIVESNLSSEFLKIEFERLYEKAMDKKLK